VGVSELDAMENIWTYEGRDGKRLKKMHNKELHNLHALPNIIRVIKSKSMRQVGTAENMGDIRDTYNILVGKSEGETPLRKPRHRWKDNIRMDLSETG
jgi:hypothetical protein